MCGIVAAFYTEATKEKISHCLKILKHRGPDSEGQWESPSAPVWLGHRRLAIVDISDAGRQPMHNEDNTLWLICNGEIYNYPELRLNLEHLGHRFYSNSDSEIILHAYENWGDELLEHLEGMFAFALWDEKRQRLFVARDRVGIKPLYYAIVGKGLVLASEISALLPLIEQKPCPEPTALAYFMTLGYIPSPWSIWQGIKKLEPGNLFTWHINTGICLRRYWEPPRYINDEAKSNGKEWQNIFLKILKEHLLSDVPISLFLSGGLDSTSLALGLKELGENIPAITVSFPGSNLDETPFAKDVAQHLGFPHHVIPLNVSDVVELLHNVAVTFDEPQGYSALLSMYLISQVTAKDFKVVIAGDGGDEIFGGYTWHHNLDGSFPQHSQYIRNMLRPLIKHNASPFFRRKAMQHFSQISPLHRHAWRLYPRFLPEEVEALFSPLGLRFGDSEMLAPLRKYYEPRLPMKRALQRIDLMTFCTDSILAKVDRASMAHSLEVRVPFLDRKLIEWALTRPLQRREEDESKPILRDYLRSRVPASVLNHPKQGFSLSILDNFNWETAIEKIRQGTWVRQRYWTSNWEQLIQPGVPFRTGRIWNLLMLTCWADIWLSTRNHKYDDI